MTYLAFRTMYHLGESPENNEVKLCYFLHDHVFHQMVME